MPENPNTSDEVNDTGCGYGKCKPGFLQVFNNPKFMLFASCFLVIAQGFAVNGIFNVNVTSLERRFHLRSTELGFISASYDLSAAFFGIFISYFGSGRNKPRWITLAAIAFAGAALLMALPHFITGQYRWGKEYVRICQDGESASTDLCATSSLRSNIWYFIIGMVMNGIGGASLYTVGTGFIDDSVTAVYSPVYLGLFFGFAALGPGIGYLVGGALLNIYVDYDKTDAESPLKQIDPRYVGAWWIGHLIALAFFVISIIPFSCFGAEMPSAEMVRKSRISQLHKGNTLDVVYAKPQRPPFKTLPKVVLALLKNPPFLFTTFGGICDFFVGSGIATFLPKFLQNNFHVSSGHAGIYSGIPLILGLTGGIMFGGFVCRCFKLKVKGMLMFCVGASFVGLLFTPLFWTKCETSKFAGVDVGFFNTDSTISQIDTCNRNCACAFRYYDPVCNNGIQYFSPCIAGCNEYSSTTKSFSNCTCVPVPSNKNVSMVTAGRCDSSCDQLYIILPLIFVYTFATIAADVPAEQAVLRSIDQNHRVISLGFNRFIIRIAGSFIGPIVFGAATDSACSVWQMECTEKTSCWVYDNFIVRRNYFIIAIIMKLLSVVFFSMAYCLYKPPKKGNAMKTSDNENMEATFTNEAYTSE